MNPDIQTIISIYREDLKMHVTDDYDKVTARINAQMSKKLSEANSPEPLVARAANDWIDRMTPLLKGQSTFDQYIGEVRNVVEAEFKENVATILATGGKIDAGWISKQTETFAKRYYLDEAFATRILDGLVDDADLAVELEPVTNLKAEYDLAADRVTLCWNNPNSPKLWGSVEILRSDLGSPLSRGKIRDYIDDSISGGQRYRYTVTVVGKDGVTKSSPATMDVLCISEVSGFVGVYGVHHV